jgi:benzoyl-CoA reductase/2-hydroxyglutaryl-CoA dehydratase subunit BcrC/BadD/HgdB
MIYYSLLDSKFKSLEENLQMIQNENSKDEMLIIEDVMMPDEIKARVAKEKLPEDLGFVMDTMKDGQSIFIKSNNVQRKLHALRSKSYRWRQKNEDDPHQFTFLEELDNDGNTGIRMFKYIPSGESS